MPGVLVAVISAGPASVLAAAPLGAAPSPSSSPAPAESGSALPSWLLVALIVLVAIVVIAMFLLTAYSLSAPRSTLKNVLGVKRGGYRDKRGRRLRNRGGGQAGGGNDNSLHKDPAWLTTQMVEQLSKAARVGRRTTRATLAIAGFSLLGVVIIAVFGLSGQGVPDLRSGVLASVTTLVAAIAGFYFGAQTASKGDSKAGNEAAKAAPGLGKGSGPAGFTVGSKGTFTPVLTGTPPPTVNLTSGHLPAGLELDETTGVIAGTPAAGTVGEYDLTLAASNAVLPPATLQVKLTVSERPVADS